MAALYDEFMIDAPYQEWVRFTKEILKDRHIKEIIDLGCGTGEITLKLSEAGFQLFGVDYSEDMLTLAAQKAMEVNLPIQWYCQDLRSLEGFSNIDCAISYCDVINYITEKDELENVFGRVYDLLKPGGIYLFDVHSIFRIESRYKNQTFADVLEDSAYIWNCVEGESPGEVFHDLTFFTIKGDHYIRFDEYHHQRTYPIHIYQKILQDSGFENIKTYADFSLKENNVKEESERIFFYAEKRKE